MCILFSLSISFWADSMVGFDTFVGSSFAFVVLRLSSWLNEDSRSGGSLFGQLRLIQRFLATHARKLKE